MINSSIIIWILSIDNVLEILMASWLVDSKICTKGYFGLEYVEDKRDYLKLFVTVNSVKKVGEI